MSEAIIYERKAQSALDKLGLSMASDRLDQTSQQAVSENWSYSHFLGYLLDAEMQERRRRTIKINMQFANFPSVKRLDDFNFDAQPSLDRRIIDELATGRFLEEGRNAVFLGPPGVGKTHLAIGLGVLTAERENRVYYTQAIDMARKLAKAMAENKLKREINNLTRPKLLIIDEVGYLELDRVQASLLFQVICQRYELNQSIILTSNKPFSDWGCIFANDAVMASAALDRLLHRCTVLNIRGDSYRLKDRRKAKDITDEFPKKGGDTQQL